MDTTGMLGWPHTTPHGPVDNWRGRPEARGSSCAGGAHLKKVGLLRWSTRRGPHDRASTRDSLETRYQARVSRQRALRKLGIRTLAACTTWSASPRLGRCWSSHFALGNGRSCHLDPQHRCFRESGAAKTQHSSTTEAHARVAIASLGGLSSRHSCAEPLEHSLRRLAHPQPMRSPQPLAPSQPMGSAEPFGPQRNIGPPQLTDRCSQVLRLTRKVLRRRAKRHTLRWAAP